MKSAVACGSRCLTPHRLNEVEGVPHLCLTCRYDHARGSRRAGRAITLIIEPGPPSCGRRARSCSPRFPRGVSQVRCHHALGVAAIRSFEQRSSRYRDDRSRMLGSRSRIIDRLTERQCPHSPVTLVRPREAGSRAAVARSSVSEIRLSRSGGRSCYGNTRWCARPRSTR